MANTYQDIYQRQLAKALFKSQQPNLTPSQKANLTKTIKKLQDKLAWVELPDLPAEMKELEE